MRIYLELTTLSRDKTVRTHETHPNQEPKSFEAIRKIKSLKSLFKTSGPPQKFVKNLEKNKNEGSPSFFVKKLSVNCVLSFHRFLHPVQAVREAKCMGMVIMMRMLGTMVWLSN